MLFRGRHVDDARREQELHVTAKQITLDSDCKKKSIFVVSNASRV